MVSGQLWLSEVRWGVVVCGGLMFCLVRFGMGF